MNLFFVCTHDNSSMNFSCAYDVVMTGREGGRDTHTFTRMIESTLAGCLL